MKKFAGLCVAMVVLAGAVGAFAGEGCCPASKAKAAQAKSGSCLDTFAGIKLSDEQRTKLAALEKECAAAKCSDEARAKFAKGAKEVLTAEQYAQWEAACQKASKPAGGCTRPMDTKS